MSEFKMYDAIVIGAGVAGLTAAAELAHRNVRTLVVERHNVAGGCASYYQRDGYRFDVGATLSSGFGMRGVHRLLNARFGMVVSPEPIEPAMIVHLPDATIARYGDERWRSQRLRAFGTEAEPFWEQQEKFADLAWDFSSRFPALPVDIPSAAAALGAVRPRNIGLLRTLGRSVTSIMPRSASRRLRLFVDAQLLITAQADAAGTALSYGCTALDIAREGTFHLPGGISALSVALARNIRHAGGRIVYRRSVAAIETSRRRVAAILLTDGTRVACRSIIAAIPIHNVFALCDGFPKRFRARVASLPQRWGAFTLYCGLPAGVVPRDFPSHHQLVATYDAPLGEGNTVFISISDPADPSRARNGGRALTLSTHTDVARWERAYRDGTQLALRTEYTARLSRALERVLPGAVATATVLECADPRTFVQYTGRYRGLVGGLPQTSLLHSLTQRSPISGLYLAGDTIFPGQSTVGAALGALAAARSLVAEL